MNALSSLAVTILSVLRSCKGPEQAMTAPAIAELLSTSAHKVTERKVRDVIATECDEIAATLRPAILLSKPGGGFYLAADDQQIAAREALLRKLARNASAKHRAFVATVKAAGLEAVLDRKAVAA